MRIIWVCGVIGFGVVRPSLTLRLGTVSANTHAFDAQVAVSNYPLEYVPANLTSQHSYDHCCASASMRADMRGDIWGCTANERARSSSTLIEHVFPLHRLELLCRLAFWRECQSSAAYRFELVGQYTCTGIPTRKRKRRRGSKPSSP